MSVVILSLNNLVKINCAYEPGKFSFNKYLADLSKPSSRSLEELHNNFWTLCYNNDTCNDNCDFLERYYYRVNHRHFCSLFSYIEKELQVLLFHNNNSLRCDDCKGLIKCL